MPFRRRASPAPSVISVSPSPGAKHGRGFDEDVRLFARPGQRDTSDAWRQDRFSTPHQTGRVRPEDQAGIVLLVSDATIFRAILFGASVSNLASHPILILTVWLCYALYAFYGDLMGPFAAGMIVTMFRTLILIMTIMLFIGFIKVVKLFW